MGDAVTVEHDGGVIKITINRSEASTASGLVAGAPSGKGR
jgi:hypothetical protein